MLVLVIKYTTNSHRNSVERYALYIIDFKPILDEIELRFTKFGTSRDFAYLSIHRDTKLNPAIIEFDIANRWIFDSKYA